MADVKIDMMLADSSGSIGKRTNETKALNTELTKTQKLARGAMGSGGGLMAAQESQDYGRGRAAIGTGAAARDFANQAQGLGGLVRVYATFAANLFAVGAAFNALKNAADTTNLVKGLEQLGVASGVNLPKVAKDLAAVSGGAVSLREAMTATAQASSAGMSAENIKRMGEVARNASQALGVDMTAALDRISRGITKLEPELLDEIGIFTRTEQASIDYARSLGKSVSALTNFEKRQAFANAVLAEGEEKFGAIALQTNPYNKLLASLKNLTQAGLELVNKVLGPLINTLSESPAALGVALAAIAGILVRQAIPAITQWRTELSEGVERASASAAENLEYFRNYQRDIAESAAKSISQPIKDQVAAAGTAWQGLQEETRKGVLGTSTTLNRELKKVMKVDLTETTQGQLQQLDALKKRYESAAARSSSDPARKQAAQDRLQEFQKIEPEIRKAIQAQQDYNNALKAATPTSLTVQGQLLQRIATNAENAEKKMRILVNAADNAAFSGPIRAFQSMNASIAKLPPSIGVVSREMLRLRATMTIAAVAVGTVTTAFGNLLGAIGVITGVGMLLSSVFSTNGDQAAKATKSIDDLKSAGDNLDRVLESISKKTPLQQLSSQSISASAVAMGDLTTAINQAIKDTDASIAARSWYDSFTNALASIIGKSDEQVLEKTITKQLNNILKTASTSIDAADIRKDLTRALGLGEGASEPDIVKAFTANIKTAAPELQKIIDKFKSSAQSGKAFSDNLKELSKTFQDMTNELLPKGKLVDAVNQSTTAYSDLSKLLDGPVSVSMAAMNDLLKNSQALSMLPPDSRQALLSAVPAIDAVSARMAENQLAISNASIELDKYSSKLESMRGEVGSARVEREDGSIGQVRVIRAELAQASERARSVIERAQREVASDSKVLEGYKETFRKATEEGFKANSDLLTDIFRNAAEKARLDFEQKALSKLPATPDVIDRQTDIRKRQIDLDTRGQILQARLILTQERTNAELALLRITVERDRLARQGSADGGGLDKLLGDLTNEETRIRANLKGIEQIESGKSISKETTAAMGKSDALRLQQIGGSFAQIRNAGETAKRGEELEGTIQKIGLSFTRASEVYTNIIQGIENDIKSRLGRVESGTEEEKSAVAAEVAALRQRQRDFETAKNLLKPGEQEAIARLSAPLTQLSPAARQGAIERAGQPATAIQAQAQAETQIADIAERTRVSKELTEKYQRQINSQLELASIEFKLQADLAGLQETSKNQQLDYESQLLNLALDKGNISKDEFNQQQRSLQLKKIELDYEKTLADLRRGRARDIADLNKELMEKTGGTGELSMLSEEQQASFTARASAIGTFYDAATAAAGRFKDQQFSILSQQDILLDRQLEYAKAFESIFDGMADALVDFVKTGKLNFKDLVNSMLADLARYELRLLMSSLYKSLRPGLMNFVGSLFGAGGTNFGTAGFSSPGAASPFAYGGAFNDTGVMKYAKGGTFTNSIVSSPTLFKFAKGTGLMGEAGPEAIMPLKRDPQGNLGVRGSGGGSVEVVVNNYSTAKAETRETTDGRGNRKVEVLIGEMTAGEVNRSGSSTNRAIQGTFGIQPQLIRR